MQGYEITDGMRALLIDWLVQVHSRFQLLQETLYLTVAILDRFLQVMFLNSLVYGFDLDLKGFFWLCCRSSQCLAGSCNLSV